MHEALDRTGAVCRGHSAQCTAITTPMDRSNLRQRSCCYASRSGSMLRHGAIFLVIAVGYLPVSTGAGIGAPDLDSSATSGTAIGSFTAADGKLSIAMGEYAVALGDASTAISDSATASGSAVLAAGDITTATGVPSAAIGVVTVASGDCSFATGCAAVASGHYSLAAGGITLASGDYSVVAGLGTNASGAFSAAIGMFTVAAGDASIATGSYTTASGDASAAMGERTTASGRSSTAMGEHTVAQSTAELTLGRYNEVSSNPNPTEWDVTDAILRVGNGSPTNRSDALRVMKSGITQVRVLEAATLVVGGVDVLLTLVSLQTELAATTALLTGMQSQLARLASELAENTALLDEALAKVDWVIISESLP